MLNRRLLLGSLSALPFAPSLVLAQTLPGVIVASGAANGTYHRLVTELGVACAGSLLINHWSDNGRFSAGSVDSLRLVMGNLAELGVVQTDILHLARNGEAPGTAAASSVNSLVTIVVFHSEEIHLVARSAPIVSGGIAGFGSTTTQLNSIQDLRNRKVGAWGGSVMTARVINANASTGLDIVEFPGQAEALAHLRASKIDAILAVGGQPLSWVSQLNREFKLLEIPEQTSRQLQAIYRTASIIYPNLGATTGVPTISVDALLVARTPRGRARVNAYIALRTCISEGIDDIRETRGTHPKWQEIDPDREARWPMFQPLAPR